VRVLHVGVAYDIHFNVQAIQKNDCLSYFTRSLRRELFLTYQANLAILAPRPERGTAGIALIHFSS
jgi:hypothetical protein